LRKLVANDLYRIKLVNDVQIYSGDEILFTQTYLDEQNQKYVNNIYSISEDKKVVYSYLEEGKNNFINATFSFDNNYVIYISDISGSNQIWILDRKTKVKKKLTEMKYGVKEFKLSTDTKAIYFVSEGKEDETEQYLIQSMSKQEKEKAESLKKEKPIRIKNMAYKYEGIGILPERKTHIWKLDLNNGQIIKLTKDQHNYRDIGISNNGKYLTYISDPLDGCDYRAEDKHLWLMDMETGESKLLLDGHIYIEHPIISNDRRIAFIGHDLAYGWGTVNRIYVLDIAKSKLTCLSQDFDLSIGDTAISDMRGAGVQRGLYWNHEKDELYFLSSIEGNTHILKINKNGEVKTVVGGERQIFSFSIDKEFKKLVFCYSNSTIPNDIAIYYLFENREENLTHINKDYLLEVELSKPEKINFKSFDETEIEGWIMKPIEFNCNERYPAILEIHGGPQMMYAETFMFEFQLLATQGYAVIYFNPRGSTGKTQRFTAGIRREFGNVGGGDYRDLMLGVDYMLENFKYIDKDRLGVTGGSYGGFMTNWIVGHTNRFKAAVTQRSISNWFSKVGVGDLGFCQAELGLQCDFFNDKEEIERVSPITYVQNIETPLLIMHSECDYRCPIEQAQQLFVQLKMLRKNVEMLIFPESNHGLSRNGKPCLRIERLEGALAWFQEYLKI